MDNNGAQCEMPKYKCHKEVWALKIAKIEFEGDNTWTITPEEPEYAPFKIDGIYFDKHKPQAGGYYVVYEDGYKSFSPAEAFEAGYTII